MQVHKTSKLVEYCSNSSSDSNGEIPNKPDDCIQSVLNGTIITNNNNNHPIISSSPIMSLEPIFVRNPQIVNLNTEWCLQHQPPNSTVVGKLTTHSARQMKPTNFPPDQNLYEKVIEDEAIMEQVGNKTSGIANRIMSSNSDLFSMYSRSMINLQPNYPPIPSPRSWSPLADQITTTPTTSTTRTNSPVQYQSITTNTITTNNKIPSALPLDPLNAKRLNELDTLLFPRIRENSRSPSVNNAFQEKSTEIINMERLKNKTTLLSHYFEDGKRRVDYVIVFIKPTNLHPKSEELLHYEQRSIFEANLRGEGLHLEYTEDLSNAGYVFVKIYAPWAVLTRYAEIMKLKMPMKTMQTTWKMLFDEDDHHTMRFTVPYSKDKEYLFDIPPQKELFFSTAQRAQVVEFILKRKSFSRNQDDVTEFGINKLLSDKVYIAAYPIHEGKLNSDYRSPRMQLIQNWASVRQAFKNQPLDEIRGYFGVKIALYFAWLGFYTSMLIPASVVGVLCFLFGSFTLDKDIPSKEVCNGTYDHILMCPQCAHDCNFTRVSESCIYQRTTYLFDNPATVFFAIFMSIWATVYLEMWKRYSARITYRWDLSNFDAVEEYPRPEYLARLANVSNRRLNVITRMYEPYIPFWRRQLPYTILSASVVLFLILIAIGSVVSVIVYRSTIRSAIRSAIRFKRNDENKIMNIKQLPFLQKYSSIVVSSSAAGLNLIFILILNNIYSRIAAYLTELEMPRTQTEFDNSLTLKMFLLQFVNYYSSIFYIAFFKGRFIGNPGEFNDESLTQEECATGGCLLELAIQLAIIMIGRQMFSAAIELCWPLVQNLYSRWVYRKEDKVTRMNVPQWEDDFLLTRWSPTSLFYEYLEMVIQFGFVTIFVSAFPLAPLFALINNVFEIRLDARKMITTFKRPVAQRVKNIGIWYRILDTICKLSVITNGMIIAFTTEFVPRAYYIFEHGNLNGYINSTLAFFDAKVVNEHLKLDYDSSKLGYCVYPDYREPPWVEESRRYKFTSYYWRLLAVRLSFVVVFENVIATITSLMRWIIPDVPQQLRQQMRQHAYLTNELILHQEFQRAKDMSNEMKSTRRTSQKYNNNNKHNHQMMMDSGKKKKISSANNADLSTTTTTTTPTPTTTTTINFASPNNNNNNNSASFVETLDRKMQNYQTSSVTVGNNIDRLKNGSIVLEQYYDIDDDDNNNKKMHSMIPAHTGTTAVVAAIARGGGGGGGNNNNKKDSSNSTRLRRRSTTNNNTNGGGNGSGGVISSIRSNGGSGGGGGDENRSSTTAGSSAASSDCHLSSDSESLLDDGEEESNNSFKGEEEEDYFNSQYLSEATSQDQLINNNNKDNDNNGRGNRRNANGNRNDNGGGNS